MNNQTLQQKLAWQTAYQLRACPNDEMLFSARNRKKAAMSAHLAICSFCNERLELSKGDRSALVDFSNQVLSRLQQPLKSEPKAGQVWTLSTKSAAWGPRNRHYNPPRVLLLNAIEGSKGFIASQLFSEKALMWQGDVWLSEALGFAEAWNTYSVHADMLESCWGEVSKSVLTDVCRAAEKDWESSPEGSLLHSFRQIEVSVASFFSMQAVAQLAAEHEAAPELSKVFSDAMQKIKEFVIDLTSVDLDLLGRYFAEPVLARGAEEPKLPLFVVGVAVLGSKGTDLATTVPGLARQTYDGLVDSELVSKIASLKDDEAIKLLPIDHGQFKVGYKLKFRDLSWLSVEPLPVCVTLRGEVVKKVHWEHWGTEDTWLVLHDTVIGENEKRTDRTFLSISWSESGLNIDLLP
jgi:hypothetical protein